MSSYTERESACSHPFAALVGDPSDYPSPCPTLQQLPGRPIQLNVTKRSGLSSPAAVKPVPNIIEPNSPTSHSSNAHRSIAYECQLEVITAAAMVAIQVQLLSMVVAKVSRDLLSISITLELLGILLAICLSQVHTKDNIHPPQPRFISLALRAPTVLILTGIIGLGVVLVVETLETSLPTAVTMSSFLAFGVLLCLLTLLYGSKKADGGENEIDYS